MKKSLVKVSFFSVIAFFLFLQVLPYMPVSIQNIPSMQQLKKMSLFNPPQIDATGLSSSSATLSNPRLSYMASLSTGYSAGASYIAIGTSGPDTTTSNLFPGDLVGIGKVGGVMNANLEINTIVDGTTFSLKNPLINPVTIAANDRVYATQSGSITVDFYTADPIPNNGSVKVKVPLATAPTYSGSNTDGVPDTNTLATNGFDANAVTGVNGAWNSGNISCPGGFTAGTPTIVSNYLEVYCNWAGGAILPAGAHITIQIGNNPTVAGGKQLVNPAPRSDSHVVGTSDIYTISAYTTTTTNGGGSTIGFVDMKIAANEGVLVSATVDETLTFTVAGILNTAIGSTCGFTPAGTIVTTTPYSVPFGNPTADAFYNGAHKLTVTTNSPSGYVVKVDETDQMGLNGARCVGAGGTSCIQDTTCQATPCNATTNRDWTVPGTYHGLGYSLSNVTGSAAAFQYSAGTFSAKAFADAADGGAKQTIMTNSGVVSTDSICSVLRLSVAGTQTAGTYWNIVRYTASTLF